MSAPHPSKSEDLSRAYPVVASYSGADLVSWGRVMQEEAVHSFVHSLPPCTLAWHVLACHVSMLTWLPGLPVWLLSAPSESQGHCARWILSPELTALAAAFSLGKCSLPPGQNGPVQCGIC